MEEKEFVSRCKSDKGLELAADRQGRLWKRTVKPGETAESGVLPGEPDWQQYDFNKEYAGYYSSCRFTAVAWTGGGFLAVGLSEAAARKQVMPMAEPGQVRGSAGNEGQTTWRTVAYSSLRGGVWQPENLVAQTPEGPVVPVEPVYDICRDEVSGQTFLLGGRGQVITLTGCPKCVKVSFFGRQDIRQGRVEGEYLYLTLADGSGTKVHLHAAMQLHLSREAAEEKRRRGGIYVYVGETDEPERENITGENAVEIQVCPLPDMNGFLRTCKKEQILVFVCPSGFRAEAAAKSARAQGYREAYYTEGGIG